MFRHNDIEGTELRRMIRKGILGFGGNLKLKIYGKLNCRSGKRMKKENRVFFESEREAREAGFRPCGHCMRREYQLFKAQHKFH